MASVWHQMAQRWEKKKASRHHRSKQTSVSTPQKSVRAMPLWDTVMIALVIGSTIAFCFWIAPSHCLLDTITAGIFGLWNGGPSVGLPGSNSEPPMSALGQKRTSHQVRVMSALLPKADIS